MVKNALQTFTKHTLIYGISTGLSAMMGLILVPILTRVLSPENYGVLEILLTFISLGASALTLGFDASTSILYHTTATGHEKKQVASTAFYFLISISFLAVVVTILISNHIGILLFKNLLYNKILIISSITLFFTILYNFLANLTRVVIKPYSYLILVGIKTILTIGIMITFYLQSKLKINEVIYTYLVSVLITTIIGVYINYKWLIFSFSLKKLKNLTSIGLPIALASISIWILHASDRIFLVHLTSLKEVGVYALGARVSQILSLFISAFQLGLGPFALSIYHESNAKTVFAKLLTYYLVITTFFALILSLFSEKIVSMISTSSGYYEAARVIPLLSIATVSYGMYFFAAIGVNIVKKTIHILWTVTIAATSNIILNFLLIPTFTIRGAAIATLISYSISTYLLFKISQYYYFIPYEFKKATLVLGTSIIIIIINTIFSTNVLFKVIFLLAFIGIILVTKTITIKEISRLFKFNHISQRIPSRQTNME